MKPFSLLAFIALLFCGCTSSLVIESNESLLRNNFKDVKLVCIDPRFYFDDETKNYALEEPEKLTNQLRKDIQRFSKKNEIDLTLFDVNTLTSSSYQDLLLLKQNMLDANFYQSTPLNFNNSNYKRKTIQKRVFVYPPKVSYEFSALKSKYGTSLFSYMGIYSVKDKIILYHIVVDTDRSETIYREYKVIKSKINDGKIAQMIYDSYAMLGKELKRK